MGHSSYNPGVSSIKDAHIDPKGDKEVEEVNLEVTHLKYAFKETVSCRGPASQRSFFSCSFLAPYGLTS